MGKSAQGFPSKSMMVPITFPSCAAARGATTPTNPTINNAASAYAFQNFHILHSPFVFEEPGLGSTAGTPTLSLISRGFQWPPSARLRPARGPLPIRDGVGHPRFRKRPQAQQTTVTLPAGQLLSLIARPRQVQRRAEFPATPNDLAFLHPDHRRGHLDLRLRLGSHPNQLLKHAIIFRPAVRITGTVFLHGPDVNGPSPNGLRPANSHAEEMGIAKGHISHRNRTFDGLRCPQLILRHLDFLVRKRRPANRPKMIQIHNQPLPRSVEIRDIVE